MIREQIKMVDIKDIEYNNEYVSSLKTGIYAEVMLLRDRASFAGVGFRIINQPNVFVSSNELKEDIIQEVSKYDNLRIGMELDYIESMKKVYKQANVNYGLELFFLIYSDIRSCSKIFEELMKEICKKIPNFDSYQKRKV